MDTQYKNMEHVHIPDRPSGAIEDTQIQALRGAGQQGGLQHWERASIEYEHFLNMGYLKQALERDRREKGE